MLEKRTRPATTMLAESPRRDTSERTRRLAAIRGLLLRRKTELDMRDGELLELLREGFSANEAQLEQYLRTGQIAATHKQHFLAFVVQRWQGLSILEDNGRDESAVRKYLAEQSLEHLLQLR